MKQVFKSLTLRFSTFGKIGSLGIFLVISFCLISLSSAQASPRFLIFHLDAVSSQNFFRYMEQGDLPNIKTFFEDGHMIHYGLSLYPGGTETTVPHMKDGADNSTGGVGWGYYDRKKEKKFTKYRMLFYWLS